MVRVDGGHVEADVAHVASDRGGLRTCHALEHLEFDGVVHAAGTREFVGEGDVEDVVAGHAHAQAVQVLAPQDPVEDPLVVRVGVLLRRAHRHGPSRELAVHLFHRQVRALDEADLDARTAAGDALGGEGGEPLDGIQRVRQVRLDDDAGLVVEQLRLAQQAGEDRDRELEVLVLLHVEVDEGGAGGLGGGEAQQRAQALAHHVRGLLECPQVDLGRDRRHLHGHVVDVVAVEEALDLVGVVLSLGLAEHRLAQQVDVELGSVGAQGTDRSAERTRPGVDDHVAEHLAHPRPGGGHDDLGDDGGECRARADLRAVQCGEGRGCVLRDVDERGTCGVRVLRADHPVDESHGEVDAPLVAEDRGEPVRARVLDLQAGGDAQPAARGVDGAIGDLGQLRDPGGRRAVCVGGRGTGD